MNKIKKFARKVKDSVAKHRVALAVGSTALVCTAINRQAVRDYNKFLTEKNLWEEFADYQG